MMQLSNKTESILAKLILHHIVLLGYFLLQHYCNVVNHGKDQAVSR